jgi:hypothetical protein
VQHRFCFGGRIRPVQPKAVSALRFATALQNLTEMRHRSVLAMLLW